MSSTLIHLKGLESDNWSIWLLSSYVRNLGSHQEDQLSDCLGSIFGLTS